MNDDQFSCWLLEHHIDGCAEKIIRRIRISPPFRSVQSGRSNVTGRYPSQKMGHTIQFESHKVEQAFIREYEFDESVLEYYDQPGPIKISYFTNTGRHTTALTTPDFFVIRNDGTAGWEECKPEQDLERLAQKSERFVRDKEGQWKCPSGAEYAAKHGLFFRVRSSAEINWVWQRNIEYLSDYLQTPNLSVAPEAEYSIKSIVSCKPGILLSDLIAIVRRDTPDEIFQLIARKELYVNLHAHPLSEPDRTPVYTDHEQASFCMPPIPKLGSSPITVEPGSTLIWDGRFFQVVNAGDDNIWLQSAQGDLTTLEYCKFDELVRTGAVMCGSEERSESTDRICSFLKTKGPNAYAGAIMRYKAIAAHLSGTTNQPTTRTERNWIKRYHEAETFYGSGFLGLFDNNEKKGNRLPKLPFESHELMKTSIDEQYLTTTQISAATVYGHYRNLCENGNVIAASFKTFTATLKQLDAKETEMKRKGRRAAYQLDVFYWELEMTTPRHGDRPFEIVHLDHTESDIELVDPVTGNNLGRPWLTLMVDAYCRRILAFILSFEPPSYRSCMMVIRECVLIHNRLPQTIVVDGGSDFNSVYFEQLIAFNGIVKKNRPGAQPRYGSIIERLFGTTNKQFIHSLLGNTQIAKDVRQVTKSVNPSNLAVWTLPKLKERISRYFKEVYEKLDHPALGESPISAFERGLSKHGVRPMKFVRYDEAFILSTLPSTPKGHAKVIRSRGIKINNFYYWNDALRVTYGLNVPVRYDPYNIAVAYAFVKGQWVRCHSQFYALLQGRSEKELALITQEIKKRRSDHNRKIVINAQIVAAFIAESQEIELELKDMRRAAEMRIDKGHLNPPEEEAADFEPLHYPTSDFEIYNELTI